MLLLTYLLTYRRPDMRRLQSIHKAAAWLVTGSRRCDRSRGGDLGGQSPQIFRWRGATVKEIEERKRRYDTSDRHTSLLLASRYYDSV